MWILPTLNRPAQCAAVLKQMQEMKCSTRGVVFVNGDEKAKEYWDLAWPECPDGWVLDVCAENIGALGALNAVFREYPDEPWYGFIGDDEFVQTPEFDKKLIEAAGDWNIAHGDDGVHAGRRAQGYLVIGGKLARALGWLALPGVWHWYGLDDMWEILACEGACRKVFCPEVKVEHRHPYFGKGVRDATYAAGESHAILDYQECCAWNNARKKADVERVKAAKGGA